MYAVYDCTEDKTFVYDDVTPAPTMNPTPNPAPNPVPDPTPAPTPNPTDAPGPTSLLANWDFESPTIYPWTRTGGDGQIELVYDDDLGSNVGRAYGRNSNNAWEGIGQDTDIFEAGEDYNIEIKARMTDVADGVTSNFKLTLQVSFETASTTWLTLIWADDLTNEWQTFYGYLDFQPTDTVTSTRIFAEGAPGYDFAIDDVIVLSDLTTPAPTPSPTPAPVQSADFIDASDNTERIDIPVPPQADFGPNNNRVSCPHLDLDGSEVDWTTQFGTQLSEGQDVTIPDGVTVLITETIPTTLGYIRIPPTSTLIIGEDDTFGIEIDAQGIEVQGSLIAGSESCRLQSEVTITLHGDRPNNAPDPLYKGIEVTGTLNLHGKRFYRTWTK
ncbi:MAG: hypothetical protein SGILL_003187 [Bacillariaceae sp.]